MKDLFVVKRLLDRMDKVGPSCVTITQTVRKAATDLLMFPDSDVVRLARAYALYELECMRDSKTPLPLGQWYFKRGNLK